MTIKKSILHSLVAILLCGYASANEGIVPPPNCPTIQAIADDVTCYGDFDGQATIVLIVPSPGPYTYTWSNGFIESGFQTTSTISTLVAGGYTVNIKDETTGCVVTGAVIIDQPDPLFVSGVVNDVACFGIASGSVVTTVNGGTPGYSYSWVGPTPSTSPNLTNALAGNYTLTVTDATLACTAVRNYTIDQPNQALNSSEVVTQPSCFGGSNGSIDLSVWGGTTSYTYLWNTGANTQDIVNLSTGLYNVTITDGNGCTRTVNYNLPQPTQVTGSVSPTNVPCNGDATGSLTFSAAGGTPGYTYQWTNSTTLFAETGPTLNNVIADNYNVTVTDSRGCQLTIAGTNISEPPLLVLSTTQTPVNCNGGSDGAIDLTVVGGTGAGTYSYQWVDGLGGNVATTQDLTGQPADTYTCTVTDANACVKVISQVITEPSLPITVTYTTVDVLCRGMSTGEIDLTVTGGSPGYTFSWTSGQITEDITGIPAGVYGFTITDINGCQYNDFVVINEPSQPLTVTSVITDVNCFGESNGAINLTPSGGTGAYTFEWNNSTYQLSVITEDLTNYPADFYSYTVTDENGCLYIDTLEITEPPLLQTTVVGVDILCYGGNNGSVDLTVTGGVPNYIYAWNTLAVTEDISGLIAGYYEVLVTDDHGCTIMDSITLTEPLDSLAFSFVVEDVLCKDGTDGEIDLTITGGTTPYNYTWSNGDTQAHILNLTAGWYEFTIDDFNGCILIDSIFVDEPDAVTLNEVITPVTCFGFEDGIIDITPSGGIGPYSFTWFSSQFALSAQTEDLVDYAADIYQLEIIDSNGCFYEMFLDLPEPELLTIDYTYNTVTCNAGFDGNILVDIAGGNPGYLTTWSNGAITEDLINIPMSIYELIVVDTKGCTDSITVDITEPDAITMTFDLIEISCEDQSDGIAYADPSGGNGGYSYLWSNGDMSYMASNLDNQYYSLLVTDMLGCTGLDSIFVTKDSIGCIFPVNAFSPNGDNYNDTWVIDNMELYPNADVQVFNIWGNIVNHQQGLYEPWDGRVHDRDLPSEVYYWIINLNEPDREILKGTITILR